MKSCNHFYRRIVLLASALMALVAMPACRTVEVGENEIGEFRLGELQTVVAANFQTVYEATKAAFEEHGLFVTGDERGVVEATLTARDRSDTAVTVEIEEVAVNQTSIHIRYGLTGDAARSQILYRDIAKRL